MSYSNYFLLFPFLLYIFLSEIIKVGLLFFSIFEGDSEIENAKKGCEKGEKPRKRFFFSNKNWLEPS
jgi:hypothetical protein